VGRHGGRSDAWYVGSDFGVGSGSHSVTGAGTAVAPEREGVSVSGTLAGVGRAEGLEAPQSPPLGLGLRTTPRWWEDRSGDPSAHPWWDDAPVPPPVVVASADRRTPAMTFSPDADPFSAGGLFARGAREGEPPVVVHPAPDAAVLRGTRRPRSASATAALTGIATGGRGDDSDPDGPDTGSLVRPYVAQAAPGGEASTSTAPPTVSGQGEADTDIEVDIELGMRPARRTRRSGDPLELIVEVVPTAPASRPATTWSAPWAPEAAGKGDLPGESLFRPSTLQRSTFQAPTSATPDGGGPWTPPRQQTLPSRRVLRAQERGAVSRRAVTSNASAADLADRDPASRTAGRRIAKSGVLAVTAVGVVAASAPNAFSALGWRLPSHPANPPAQAALVGLAGSGALPAPGVSLGSPADTALLRLAPARPQPPADDAVAAQRIAADFARESAAAAARAGAVASGAGRTLVGVARAQVLAEAARKAQIAKQVSRNAVRDPRSYARLLLQERGWADQFTCLNLLWNRESGWNYQAYNPSSGAYGIPQALPGSKMASIAPDWRTNPATQIKWGLNYIAERYGTPCGAWSHSQATGWY
jgi:hypothetical protein